jgi:hypothetical protein
LSERNPGHSADYCGGDMTQTPQLNQIGRC